ncbi:MAG: hypothetical protein IJQ21_06530 [Lachnospiraceae bacterium]|nr:hypothetical protein [Lachnospiraceae bacterium]
MKTKKACIWILMTALMVSLLAGCGGKAEPDENSGLYKAVSVKAFGIEMSADEVYDDDITIELQDGGKAVFAYEGDEYKMKWSRDGKQFEAKGGGAELAGTIGDGVLLLEDILGTGMEIRLECKSLVRQSSRSDKDRSKKKADDNADAEDTITDSAEEDSTATSKPSLFSKKPAKDQFGYDMEEAKKYVGDWIGYMDLGFARDGRELHYDIPPGTGGAAVYARIVLDENGQPVVYLRAEINDWLNFREVSATLDESATMRINGIFADNGWAYVLSPPDDNNRKIEIGGPYVSTDGGELFHVYLKPIGDQWDKSELPYIKDNYFAVVNGNTREFGENGYTLDEVLEEMQETYDVRQNLELQGDEQIHLITDELPDASMLELYET